MADFEKHDFIAVKSVKRSVCALAKFDHPFAELRRKVVSGAANFWVLAQNFKALLDRFDRSLGGIRTFWSEEGVEADQVKAGLTRPF